MMALQSITNHYILIDAFQLAFKADSFKTTLGLGTSELMPVSVGGGEVETVYSEDITTRQSEFSVDLPVTPEALDYVRAWKKKQQASPLSVQVIDPTSGRTYLYSNVIITSDPEFAFGPDQYATLEMKGNPVSF